MPKVINLSLKNFDEARILFDSPDYAILFKPVAMPTAPLREDEAGTLLAFFLAACPNAKNVIGKRKPIEHGLLHRLDTATSGLVLIGKTQCAYDTLCSLQENGRITKTYVAFCDSRNFIPTRPVPFSITSKFRPFGPGGKKVKPVFLETPEAKKTKGTVYMTKIISIKKYCNTVCTVEAELTKGYRHQIRTHLSSLMLPILGDILYNTVPEQTRLQLFAVQLEFPSLTNSKELLRYKIAAPCDPVLP